MVCVAGSVQRCVWHPDGSRFLAVVDPDGREDNQLALVDVVTGTAEPIAAAPGVRNELGAPYTAASSGHRRAGHQHPRLKRLWAAVPAADLSRLRRRRRRGLPRRSRVPPRAAQG